MLPMQLEFKLPYPRQGYPDAKEMVAAYYCDLILEICLAWNKETEFTNMVSDDR